MTGELSKSVARALRPPLQVIGFVLGGIYKLLFGRADVRLSKKREEQLGQDIRQDVSFLFDELGGAIVPDPTARYPFPFDYAFVVVAVDDLFLRFFRGGGELR